MGWWLTIDVPLVYLFKCALRMFSFFKSSGWERSKASFTDWTVVAPGWFGGCPFVTLHYEFPSKGSSTTGLDEIPFFMHWHAKTYAESLSRDLHPIIRVN